MSKPIFFVQVGTLEGFHLTPDQALSIRKTFEQKLGDDYILLIIQSKETKAQMFIPSEITPIEVEDIKETIKQALK